MEKVSIIYSYINFVNDDFSNLSFLRDEDFIYLQKYKPTETKKEHALSLYFKRKYVGDFYLNEHEKPLSKNIYFNISHTHGLVMIVLAKKMVGIDVEMIKETEDKLRQFISNEEEYSYIKDDKSFFEIWTSKEGLSKANGDGLNNSIKNIPALPLNGKKTYFCKEFYAKTQEFNNYVLNVTLNTDEDFEIEITEEKLWKNGH